MSEDKRFITTRGLIITGWILLLFVGLAVVGANLYMWINGLTPPDPLQSWGGIVLGFLFDTFISLVKEFMGSESS